MSRATAPEKRRLYLPDGSYYELEDWVTDEQIEELRRQNPEILDDPTLLGSAIEGIQSIPKGVAGTALQAARGITALLPGDTGAADWIDRTQRGLYESVDPRYREAFLPKLGMGLGSTLPFLAGGAGVGLLAGRAAASATAAGLGSLSGVGDQAQRIAAQEDATGEDISLGREALAILGGGAIGATEALPLTRLFGKVAPEALTAAAKTAASREGLKRAASSRIGSAVIQGVEEGVQEWTSGLGQNLIEKGLYNPELDALYSSDDFKVGAASGALMDIVTRAIAGSYGRYSDAAAWRATADFEAQLATDRQAIQDATNKANAVQAEAGDAYTPEAHIGTYETVQNDDGTYSVVDRSTGQPVGPAVVDPQGATELINKLNRDDLNTAVVGGVLMRLRNQGRAEDPLDVHMGVLLSHPDYTHVPVEAVASLASPAPEGGSPGDPLDPRSRFARAALANSEKLQALRERGTGFIPMAEARESLTEEQWDRFANQAAAISLTQWADLNRDVSANLTRTGLPKLRTHDESTAFIESIIEDRERAIAGDGSSMRKVSNAQIAELLHNKGYKTASNLTETKNFKALAEILVGTDKLYRDSDRALLYARLATLPDRTGALRTIPDFSAPLYTQQQYNKTLEALRSADGPVEADAFYDALAMRIQPREQMIQHMKDAGVIKVSRNGKSIVAVDPETVGVNKDLERGEKILEEAIHNDGVSRQMLVEQFEAQRKMLAQEAQRTEEQIDEVMGTPEDKADYIVELADRNKKVVEKIRKEVFGRYGLGSTNVPIQFAEDMAEITKQATHYVASGKYADPEGALVVDPKSGEAKILLNAAAVDPNGDMDVDELFDAVLPTLNYEVLRWLRENEYFTQSQWEALRRFVRKGVVPQEIPEAAGKTWYSWAEEEIGGQQDVGTQEAIHETAIAKAWEAFTQGHLGTPRSASQPDRSLPATMFNRMGRYVKDVLNIGKESNLNPALSVFSDIATGDIGRRGPGRSALNPQGEIRSLKNVERGLVAADLAYKRAQADIGADDTGEPNRAGLTKEQIEKDIEHYNNEVTRAGPRIPRVGPIQNISPEALNVYYRARDESGELTPNIRFKYGRNSNEDQNPHYLKHTRRTEYETPNLTRFETIMQSIEAEKWLEDTDGTWDKIKEWFGERKTNIRESFIDSRERLEQLSRRRNKQLKEAGIPEFLADASTIAAFRFLDTSMHYLKDAITKGSIVYRNGHFKAETLVDSNGNEYDGLNDMFKLLVGPDGVNREKEAGEYLVNKRIEKLITDAMAAKSELARRSGMLSEREKNRLRKIVRKGKLVPGGKGKSMEQNLAEARAHIKDVDNDANMAHVRQFVDAYRAWNDNLIDLMVDTGILPKEDVAQWKGSMYMPFYKSHTRDTFAELRKIKGKKDRAARRALVETELEGSTDKLNVDLITSLVSNAEAIIRDAMTNVAYARAARDLLALGEARPQPQNKSDVNVIRFMSNGEEQYVQVDDPYLLHAIATTDSTLLEGWSRILPKASQVLRESVTRDPTFLARNMFRDTLSTYVTSGADFIPFLDTLKNFNSTAYEEARAAGIALDHDFVNDEARYREQIMKYLKRDEDTPKGWFSKLWEKSGEVSRMSDAATRMAVYKDVLERTGNEAEAIYQAMEIINFGRRGRDPIWRVVAASVPFLNARIQGLDVLARSFTGSYSTHGDMTPNEVRNKMLLRGAFLAASTGVYYAMVSDEDWYKNMRDELKDDYWFVPLGDGTLFRVPIPFEVGLLYKTIPEVMLRTLNEEGFALSDAAKSIRREFGQTANVNITPQIVSPIIDVLRNRDDYTGREIVSPYIENSIEPGAQSTPDTNELARVIGESLNLSPPKIEYLIDGYFGPLAVYAGTVADAVTRQFTGTTSAGTRQDWQAIGNMPFLRGMFMNERSGGGYQSKFYELRQEVDKAVGTLSQYRDKGDFEKAQAYRQENAALFNVRGTVRSLDRYMQRWRTRRERLLASNTMTPDAKRDAMKRLEEERDLQLAIVPFLMEATKGAR